MNSPVFAFYRILHLFQAHWGLICVGLLTLRVGWSFLHNEDLRDYRPHLKTGVIILLATFVVGWAIGELSGSQWLGLGSSFILALPTLYILARIFDQGFNDLMGGIVFDILFAEGDFAERGQAGRKKPSVLLLRHWRDNGKVGKAYRAARPFLDNNGDHYDLWLFAIETAVVHQNLPKKGRRLLRGLLRRDAFTDDQKIFATRQLKAWAASQGLEIDIEHHVAAKRRTALDKAILLRDLGYFEEAERQLKRALWRDPDNIMAAQLLIRLYAQDLKLPASAEKELRALRLQPFVPDSLVTFIEQSLPEWNRQKPSRPARKRPWWARLGPGPSSESAARFRVPGPPAPVASETTTAVDPQITVAELLEDGRIETALRQAEAEAREKPDSFPAQRQLLDAHCRGYTSIKTAEKLLAQIESHPQFAENQKEEARQMLEAARQQTQSVTRRIY